MGKFSFDTIAIHGVDAGEKKEKDQYGSLVTPIYNSSTFIFDSTAQGAARFALEEPGYIYTRIGNPSCTALENKIAKLEGGEAAIATATGMGAVTATIWTCISGGEEIVTDKALYGCTFEFFEHHLSRFGVKVHFIDMTNEEEFRAALNDRTRIVYLESPINPNLKITDIRKTAKIAHEHNPEIKVICDNTFATPYLQKPLELGADIVVHSATKYLNGHGDLLAGFIISDQETINDIRLIGIKDMTGASMAANEAYLVERGLKTMAVRMERHCKSAQKIAEFLAESDKIETVYYPGLPGHKDHELAMEQMNGLGGGMVSFIVKGGREKAARVTDGVRLATLAVSLGAAETLIEHPASMTHSPYTEEELEAANIPPGLIRLSVGLEDVDDLISDLKQALDLV